MFNQSFRRWFVPLIVGLCVLVLDQLSKQWVLQELGPEPLVHFKPLIGDWFRLVYSQNTGVAFNLFQDRSSFFIITSILISLGMLYVYHVYLPNQSPFVQFSIGAILGGAVGNTIDRIRLGFVVDFVQVGWWPVFNIADSAITTGAIILSLYLLLTGGEPDESTSSQPHDDALLHELLHQDIGRNDQSASTSTARGNRQ